MLLWIFWDVFIVLWGFNFVGVLIFFFFVFVIVIDDGILVFGVDDFWLICWFFVVMVFWRVLDNVCGLGGRVGFLVFFFVDWILLEGILWVFGRVVGVDLIIFIGVVIIVILGLVFMFCIIIMVVFIGEVIIVFMLVEFFVFVLFLFKVL